MTYKQRATVANKHDTTRVPEQNALSLYKSSINVLGVINKRFILISRSAREDAVSLLASVWVSAEVESFCQRSLSLSCNGKWVPELRGEWSRSRWAECPGRRGWGWGRGELRPSCSPQVTGNIRAQIPRQLSRDERGKLDKSSSSYLAFY